MAEKEVKVIVSGDSSGAESAMKKAGKAADNMTNSVEKVGRAKGLDELNAKAKKATAGISGLSGALEALKGAAALGAIAGVVTQITNMGTAAVMAAAKMKQYEIAFSTMLKSAEKGKVMMQDLKYFAERTPFDVPGVVTAGQQLVAFGFEAKEIIPTLTTLGDAAAGLGKGSEGVKLMAYALGQIRTSGTLKSQDMMQLTSAGVAAWDMLAEASGKSIKEIKDMAANGMIDSAAAIAVITDGMKNSYGGMMEELSKEVVGLVSNISESTGNLAADIGQYITDSFGLKAILKGMSEAIGEMSTAFRVAKDSSKSFGEALVSAVPASVLAALGTVVALIGVALVAAIGAAVTAIGAILAPIAGTIVAIAAIGAGVSVLLATSETARNVLSAAFDAVKSVINGVVAVVGDLVAIFTDSSKTFSDSYLEAVGYVAGLFYRLADNIWEAMDNALNAVGDFVAQSINGFMEFLTAGSESGDSFVDIMDNMAKNAVTSIVDWFKSLPSKLANIFNSIKAGFSLSADGSSLGIKGWMSSGNSDDYDLIKEGFDVYSGEKAAKIAKGTFDLSGDSSGNAKSSKGGGGLDRTEREVSRINEALAKANDATDDLKNKFFDMKLDIAIEGTDGSEKIFARINREKMARLQAIDETLKAQQNAANEALQLRESAEKTGDANAMSSAQALYDERNALYQESLYEAGAMRGEIEQQALDKTLSMETALHAAKADLEEAANEMSMEKYIEYLDSKDAELYARLLAEQEHKQQLLDWEMESQQTLLEFAFQAAETMKNQLASGIAAVITEGKSFGKVLQNLGKQILNMFVQWGVGRALASMMQKLFAKKDSAILAAQAAKDIAALTPPAILKEAIHPGSIATAGFTVGAVAGAGIASAGFGGDVGGGNETLTVGGNIISSSMLKMGSGSDMVSAKNSYADAGNFIGSSGFSVVQNINGDINNGSDYDDLFSSLNGTIGSALRSS